MRKSIARFRDEDYGLFIDLAPDGGRIAIDRRSGDILLDEGEGDDRFQGAAIDARMFRRFELATDEDGLAEVVLSYGEGEKHGLGITHELAVAQKWIENANRVIQKAKKLRPPQAVRQAKGKLDFTGEPWRKELDER